MEEMVYTILYKKEILDGEKLSYRFKPCYVIKGLYDENSNMFLDELNKGRFLITDPVITDDTIDYCVGEVYTKDELYKKFTDANSFEDVEIKLFKEAEENMIIGFYDEKSDEMKIKKYPFSGLISNEINSIDSNKNMNGFVDNEDSVDYYFSLKDELGYDFTLILPDQVEQLMMMDDLDEMYNYIKKLQKDKYLYEEGLAKLAPNQKFLCIDDSTLDNIKDMESVEELKDYINIFCEQNGIYKDDDLENEEYHTVDLIDTDEIKRITDYTHQVVTNSEDINEIKEALKDLLEDYKFNLEAMKALRDLNYDFSSSVTYFYVQIQCIFKILKSNDVSKIKRDYDNLYALTRDNVKLLEKEFDFANENVGNIEKVDEKVSNEDINIAIDEAMEKLNQLVGLDNVKDIFDDVFSTMLFKNRTKDNLEFDDFSKHMVFTGNPGTGKTTVASIVAPLFHKLGYIKSDKVAFVAAQDLIGKYVGQTAPKTEAVINKNKGGVIVLDEAYILAGEAQQFGNEAITVMIKEMEKNETMFIFAGYKKEMEDFIKMNSGIESRVGTFVQFNDYSEKELLEMFKKTIDKTNKSNVQEHTLTITDDALLEVSDIIHKACERSDFGNGRFVKKLFSTISREHAKNTRNYEIEEELYQITSKDIPEDIFDKIFFNKENKGAYSGNTIGFNAPVKQLKK